MAQLPASLPRVTELWKFYPNPLNFLAQARAAFGDIFVLREQGPLFSRTHDCAGVIAVFGPTHTQAVLTNTDVFGLPISAAEHLVLPQSLINLNRGLHSMRGKQHDEHQRLLMRVLNNRSIDDTHEAISAGLERFVQRWDHNQRVALLEEMRRLTLGISARLLFDERYGESGTLAALAQRYFYMRRDVTSAFYSPNETRRTELIALGSSLDHAMRKYIRWCRHDSGGGSDGLVARFARLRVGSQPCFSEDEVVAHGNVMFMSTNEPIAVALTWTLLILSQLPELRRALRDELERLPSTSGAPINSLLALPLLSAVVNESLRLFTPNALMSRITTRATSLNKVPLPERCELVLCPFLAHRDAKAFPRPTEFLPSRWQVTRPSPFEYFPFGAGGHACIGRSLGIQIIKATMAFLMQRYELVLAYDQEIDWQIDIIFTPGNDPMMNLQKPGTTGLKAGNLLGPVTELFRLKVLTRANG